MVRWVSGSFFGMISVSLLTSYAASYGQPELPPVLHTTRSSPLDLELGGNLAGVPVGETRYLRREELLALPQVTYTVDDDANFRGRAQISGVPLDGLSKQFSAKPESDLVQAICSDHYQANFPRSYIVDHHPVLVLKVNGKPPAEWPTDAEAHRAAMGPYLVSQPKFVSSFHVLSNPEEAQIPWAVIRLEFRDEAKTFAAIAPRGSQANSSEVQAGYRMALQNCFRCHNQGTEGGQKAGRPWQVLAAWAMASPEYFAAYVRNPKSKNPNSQMEANPNYDDATLQALIVYFRTFRAQEKQ